MSALSVRCSGCHERLAVPTDAAGRSFTCPKCQALVGVAEEGQTVIDGEVPDFSYLKKQVERDDDILVSESQEDGESALGESTTSRPAPRPTAKAPVPAPAPVVYTPPPADTGNPFSGLSDRQRKSPPTPQPTRTVDPPARARDRHQPADPVVRTPVWLWPALIALTVYAVAATGLATWGWVRPVAPAPTLVKPAR